jgi:hypothetical protein
MNKVTEKDHAELGPSSWDRWSNCPGSVALSRGQPNNSSIYAAQGSVAHEVADRVLREEIGSASELLGQTFQIEGFDIEVDEEMVDAVDTYVRIVHELVGDGMLMPEQQVPIGHLTGETGAEGTSDAIIIGEKHMVVIDLKYGKGVRVNAEGNGQGRMYALGALEKFKAVYDGIEDVQIVIVQPRLEDGVSQEMLNIGELEEFKDEVELAAGRVAATVAGDVSALVPGEKQCKFCPAAGICPALKAETSKQLQVFSAASAEDFMDLTMPKQAASIAVDETATNEKLAEFMRAVPLIEAAITAVRAEVERRLFAGQDVPGYYLGVGRKGNRRWDPAVDIEAELKKRLGATAAYEKKVIGVPAAEKLFKSKPRTWAKIKDLIVQPDGKPSVCQDGDKNPVYTPVTAEDFADLSAQTEAQRLLS